MRSDAFGCIWMRQMRPNAFGRFRKIFEKNTKNQIFAIFAGFLRSHAKTDVTNTFLVFFRFRYTYLKLGTTRGAHLGIG